MRRLSRWALLLCVLTLIVPAYASAHMLVHPEKMTARQQLAYGKATARHARAEIRDAKEKLSTYRAILHPRVHGWLLLRASIQDMTVRAGMHEQRVRLHNHRWLLGYGHRVISIARSRLAPPLPWAFWNCVASGWTGGHPGAGSHVSDGEGGATSYNPAGPYYGRYQMDWGFMRSHGKRMLRKYHGLDARSWSVLDQTIVAEAGYQVQGPGAWGHTAPPCVFLR